MQNARGYLTRLGVLIGVLATLLAISLACAAEKTTAPAPTATPIPTARPGLPQAVPTPTAALPTATPAPTAKIQYGGILRYATRVQPDTLDPHHTGVADIYPVALAVNDRLIQLDKDGNLAPLLARSWDIFADGKAITFNLNQGVKFQDGTAFNAQAVKWNFDRMLDPNELSPRRAELGPYVDRVEAANDSTVILRLRSAFRPLLPLLATDRPGFLVSPAAVAKYGGGKGGGFGRNPVGAGPFIFVEWAVGSHIALKKDDNYWQKGKPYLDGIRLQHVTDPSVRLAMLRTGESDILWNTYVRPQDLPILRSNPNLKTIALEGSGKHGLLFNISTKPFDNKALRQAVAYSIDREKFVNVAFPGAGKPAYTHEESGWAHNPDIKPIAFDLAKAKQKLIEAGYPGGVTLPMGCQAIPEALERCEIYQAMLKEGGVRIDIMPIDPGKMFGPTGALKTVGFKSTNWAHRADPDITLRWIFHPDGFYNIAVYKNPEVIRLLDEAVGMYDVAKAKPLYDKIQTITAEEAIWVYAVWSTKFAAMNKTVQGYTPRTIIIEELQDLWLEK